MNILRQHIEEFMRIRVEFIIDDFNEGDLVNRLNDWKWIPNHLNNADKSAIKDAIMSTVADDKKSIATMGFKSLLYDTSTEIYGMFSVEPSNELNKNAFVIRFFSSNPVSIQISTTRLVRTISEYCKTHSYKITWSKSFYILMIRNSNPIISGEPLLNNEEIKAKAKIEKKTEFTLYIFCIVIASVLITICYGIPLLFYDYYEAHPKLKIFIDLLGKLIGSVLVAGLTGYLNYYFYMSKLKKHKTIAWDVWKGDKTMDTQ